LPALSPALLATQLWLSAAPSAGDGSPQQTNASVSRFPQADGLPLLGAELFVGVPDGVGVAIVARPKRWLRLGLGALDNGAAPGVFGGGTYLPFRGWVTPSATLEGGYYFSGNANGLAQRFAGSGFQSAFLNSVQYGFVNAHVGVEMGRPRRFTFYLHGGVTYVHAQDNSFTQGLEQNTNMVWTGQPATVDVVGASAKLGFILYVG
jgi:hypothetical protein